MTVIFVLLLTLLAVLVIFTSGEKQFCNIVTLYGPLPRQD
jgi:hypothetical protein